VFALYVASDSVQANYDRPEILWLMSPLLLFWVSRALLIAHRREMDDDPIVFAIKDRVSYQVLAIVGVIFLAAL
jgi:hypothetical protein